MCPFSRFFKKNKKIEFYSTIPGVKEIYPVTPASKYIPKWFKEKNKDYVENKKKCPFKHNSDVVNCPGIREYFNTGYILYLHTDIRIITENSKIKEIKWVFDYEDSQIKTPFSKGSTIEVHEPSALGNWISPPKKAIKQLIKINSPWKVVCPEDFVLLEMYPLYSDDNRFCATGGILDPRVSRNINPAFWWFIDDGIEVIKAGTPLVQYIPIKRDNLLDLQVRDYNDKDLLYHNRYSFFFKHKQFNNYQDYMQLTKNISDMSKD